MASLDGAFCCASFAGYREYGCDLSVAKDWGGLSREQVHWLMTIHEGEWLGPALEPVVVLFNALGLLWMLATGGWLLLQNVRKQWIASRKEAGG